jgi:hypothetical protein
MGEVHDNDNNNDNDNLGKIIPVLKKDLMKT